jgi:hypothetical protein
VKGTEMKKDVNYSVLRSELLALHEDSIKAHLEKNVSFFVQDISKNYTSVSWGEIQKPTIKDIGATFTNYLENTNFSEYRDLQEPIIGFSNDGSLAWLIAQVKVTGKRKTDGEETDVDFICSWLTLYERKDDKWLRLADASTFKT